MDKIAIIESKQLKKDVAKFNVGDTVRVFVKIPEEDRVRLQAFEGIVMRKSGKGLTATFCVRKISFGEGIERVFPVHSPNVDHIELIKTGKVRRAKLYYLRKKVGKKSKVEEKEGLSENAETELSPGTEVKGEGA
jgi:large subunit ribosomal protein L19